jgi:uncharacterized protein YceK
MHLLLIIVAVFLQGCTSTVLKQIKGETQTFYANNVISANFYHAHDEFVLCIKGDLSPYQEKDIEDRFTINIPRDIGNIEKDARFKIEQMKLKEKKEGSLQTRETLHLFKLRLSDATKITGCKPVTDTSEKISILRTPIYLSYSEAATLKGKTIEAMIAKNKPFVLVIPEYLEDSLMGEETFPMLTFPLLIRDRLSPCPLYSKGCFILITNPQKKETIERKDITYSEGIIMYKFKREIKPQPWVILVLPFAVVLDFIILSFSPNS